jgi:hypothetical protein
MGGRNQAILVLLSISTALAITLGAAGPAAALPPPGDPPGTHESGAAHPSPEPHGTPTPTPIPAPRGGGVHDVPPDPWGGAGGTNAPPEPHPDAPTPTLRRVAAAVQLQNRSVSTLVSVPPGIAIDGGRPFEISVSFGVTRVTQNYDPIRGNRLAHDFPAGDGSRRVEQVDITLRETLENGEFQPYAIRSKLPVEPLYDIKISPLTWREIKACDLLSPSDPLIDWTDPTGVSHSEELDPGYFESSGFAVLRDGFEGTWTEVGATRGLTEPGIDVEEADLLPTDGGGLQNYPERGRPLLPGSSRKVRTVRARRDCSAELSYRIDYALRTYRL